MRFLLVFAMLGLLSSLANAQVAKLTCPEQKITPVFNFTGPNENIVEKMKKNISDGFSEPTEVTIIKLFDNYLIADDIKYTKINNHEFKTEVTEKGHDDILGDYTGTSEGTATLQETSDPTIYSVKLVGKGTMISDKYGNYDAMFEEDFINCKLSLISAY